MTERDPEFVWVESRLADTPLPPLLVLVGGGSGALRAIAARGAHTRVLVLEPAPARAAAFLSAGEWRDWLESGRLTYLSGPDYNGADQAWRLFPTTPGGFALLVHPALEQQPQPSTIQALRVVKGAIFGARANADAQQRLAPRYLANTLRNLPGLLAGSDVRALTDAYRGVPAVIAAAGPSLDAAIADVRRSYGHTLLIAVDTALRPLLAHGLPPHFVVGLDPSELNARHFHDLPPCPDTWLVAESALDRTATRAFEGHTCWFRVARHHPWPWLNDLGIDVGFLEVWGSVVTGAFQVAVLAGCDPIVFVGADLSYTHNRPYGRGTTYEFDAAALVRQGTPVDQPWQWLMSNSVPARDLRGDETSATEALIAFRDWMVTKIPHCGRRIVNATGNGLLFGPGIEQGRLSDVVGAATVKSPRDVPRVPVTTATPKAITSALRQVGKALDAATRRPPVATWATFVGDGWNPDAVRDAVTAAIGGLEHPSGEGSASRPSLVTAGASRILPFLPEAVARWRAAIRGDASLPPLAIDMEVERQALLLEALDLWRRLCSTAEPGRGQLPSDTLPRATVLFQGLLGAASAAAIRRHLSRFFWQAVAVEDPAALSVDATCARLAFEWIMAAHAAIRAADPIERLLRRIGGALLSGPVTLDDVVIDVPRRTLARLLTGYLQRCQPVDTVAADEPGTLMTIDLNTRSVVVARSTCERQTLDVVPLVLTDAVAPPAYISSRDDRGVVAVTAHATHSILVDANGNAVRHGEWPRPILAELAFGGGSVAWGVSVDLDRPGGYIMLRREENPEPEITDVSFTPGGGIVWRNRLYLARFPQGLVSWAPDGGTAIEVEALDDPIAAMFAAEGGLRLVGYVNDANGGLRFERTYQWDSDRGLTRSPAGSPVVSEIDTGAHGWTAEARPGSHTVRFMRATIVIDMVCDAPLRLAWLGESLIVNTADGELLLFKNLVEQLDRMVLS